MERETIALSSKKGYLMQRCYHSRDINLITLADTVRVIWTAETQWNQIVTENPNKNV